MIAWEKIKRWLEAEDADQELLEDALERVLDWIEGETGRHFREPEEFVERFDGGGERIWLRELPLESPALKVERRKDGEWDIVSDGDYERIGHELWHDEEWPGGKNDLRVTYTAGYAVGSLPGDIEELALEMLASWWRDRGRENLRSETIGGYSYTRWGPTMAADQLPGGWRETLHRWRWIQAR
ncbi:MAG: hypothetical protein ACOC92_02095 [bacterium]